MRFDGQSIRTYRPQAENPNALYSKNVQSPFFEDKQGDLWFSTYDAIHVYRRKTDDFEHFFIQNGDKKTPDGTYGIFFYEPGRRLAVNLNNDAELFWLYPEGANAVEHTIGQQYAGKVTGNRCYAKSDPDSGIVHTFFTWERSISGALGLEEYTVEAMGDTARLERRLFDGTGKLPALRIHALLSDQYDILWLATASGLVRYDKRTGICRYLNNIAAGKTFTEAEGLTQDGSNLLWVSTNLGLALFNKSSEKFEALYPPKASGADGPAGITSDLYMDKTHVLWSSIDDIGIDFTALDKPKFPVFTVPEMSGGHFTPNDMIEDRQGNIWIGSRGNKLKKHILSGPKAGTWKEYPHQTWKLLNLADGRIFVAPMDQDAYVLDPVSEEKYPVKTSDGKSIEFCDLCQAKNNTLLGVQFRDGGGLWKIERDIGLYRATKLPASPNFSPWLSKLYVDRMGHLYLVQGFNSMSVYDLNDFKPTFLRKTNLAGEAQVFYESESDVWVGGEFGICRITKKNLEERILLTRNTIYGILPDDKGDLWLSTNRGIMELQPDSLQFREYSLADGLQDYEYCPSAFLKTKDGKMWLGGIKGINVFHPDEINNITTLPNIVITALRINELADTVRRNISQLDSLYLSYDQNTLSFDFVALEYSDPARNKLLYKLRYADGAPYDDNWVTCESAKGYARYSNLPPGKYVLQIRGTNSDGVLNPVEKHLYIHISPPYYQTIPFYLFIILVLALIGYVSVRAYIQNRLRLQDLKLREQSLQIDKQEALTQERNRIAAEMHDDFGGGLTAIQRISERAATQATSTEAREAIENITRYSLELISNMREIIWAMSGKNDNLENLMAYISENAYRYLGDHNIDVDIIQPEEIPAVEMTGERRRNIYLAVKECLTNVVKHAEATSVTIRFEIDGNLEIHVRDNGKGFKNNNHDGYGMGNMAQRMTVIGGIMSIENNSGAHLIFSVPIRK